MKRPGVWGGLKIEVAESVESMGRRAARAIVAELKRKPRLLLCASAGETPTYTYRCLADRANADPTLFAKLRILQVDEWSGLARTNAATCEADLRSKLVTPLRISCDRYIGFGSDADDPEAECARISRWLAANGPIDVCILGLGMNGHVAMNEPGPAVLPEAHVARLARSSQRHALLRDLPRKPLYGLTLGMGEILSSRKILLLVSGRHKRAALKRLMKPQVTTHYPASFLWLHSDATVLCDAEAAPTSKL